MNGCVDRATVYPEMALDFVDMRGRESNVPSSSIRGITGRPSLSDSETREMDLVPRGMMSGETAAGEVVEVHIYRRS